MIVSKERIIELYEKLYCLHDNDAKRISQIHRITGADFKSVTSTIAEYQEEKHELFWRIRISQGKPRQEI